ncbi:hypothetical protein BDR05DRAFT_897382 [Suillus weaverae]|nr:hypothetical protein BDR05DRAFT_897382 [Suillus weaverae]
MNLHGASKSSGIISMACLNLPSDIRYKPENMYLAGIIPCPKQPSLEHLNHYIQPLINDMVDSWECSIKFSNTACFPTGRLTCSAIALAVCDLPAARHLASLTGTGSHFYCSTCNCYHKTMYSRVDFDSWEPHDKDELWKFAEQWRDAATTSEQEKLFKAHSVCYSELRCLPYWDPSCQLVINPMHCILEGLVQHHSRSLLSLTMATTSSSSSSSSSSSPPAFSCDLGEMPPGMTSKELTQVAAIHTFLVIQVPSDDEDLEKLRKNLSHKNTGPLKFVCKAL